MGIRRNQVVGGALNAEDVASGDILATIEDAEMREFPTDEGGKKEKLVVRFSDYEKNLICNFTNASWLFDNLGDDTDDWVGQRIRLYRGATDFGKKRNVPCVLVGEAKRRPEPSRQDRQRPSPQLEKSIDEATAADDDIPF